MQERQNTKTDLRTNIGSTVEKDNKISRLSWRLAQNYALWLAEEWRTSPTDDGSAVLAYRGSSSVAAELTVGWRLRGGLSRTSKRFTRSGKVGRRSATACQQSAMIRYLKNTKQPTTACLCSDHLPRNQSSKPLRQRALTEKTSQPNASFTAE